MSTQEEYYRKNLYPLQDGIIKIIKNTRFPFYLTGGTALSRCYYRHRYSDDLDFFVNSDENYHQYVRGILKNIKKNEAASSFVIDNDATIAEKDFTQIVVRKRTPEGQCDLAIDLINDVAVRFGQIIIHDRFGRIDNVLNILSNKLTALYRLEPKDIADIWIISRNADFNWKNIFENAKEKELGLDVLKISEIIKSFPIDYLERIKWSMPVERRVFSEHLSTIAEDLFWGKKNSLYLEEE